MKILDIPQGTLEWHAARTGMPSASQFSNIITSTGTASKSRKKYLYKLAGEKVTGHRDELYQTPAMRRGIELEPEARETFIMLTGIDVEQVGMCMHDSGLFSCSPDGIIGRNKGLEIKCPNMETHIEYLLGNKVPADYYQQVHGSMLVTGYQEWFFMSYYPGLRPFIHLEKRDNEFCDKLKAELFTFCTDLENIVEQITK